MYERMDEPNWKTKNNLIYLEVSILPPFCAFSWSPLAAAAGAGKVFLSPLAICLCLSLT